MSDSAANLQARVARLGEQLRHIEGEVRAREDQVEANTQALVAHKQRVFQEMADYFEHLKANLEARKRQLMDRYEDIEKRERRRLKQIKLQLERSQGKEQLQQVREDFDLFVSGLDDAPDSADSDFVFRRIEKAASDVREHLDKRPHFLEASRFSLPIFETVKSDAAELMGVGKVTDTSDMAEPLVVLNTYNLELFQYVEATKFFERVALVDEENLIPRLPKYFKVCFEELLLLGGYDLNQQNSSREVFQLVNGKIVRQPPMEHE